MHRSEWRILFESDLRQLEFEHLPNTRKFRFRRKLAAFQPIPVDTPVMTTLLSVMYTMPLALRNSVRLVDEADFCLVCND